MIPFFKKIVIEVVNLRNKDGKRPASPESFNRKVSNLEVEIKHEISELFVLFLGVLSASFGLKGFLMPSGFIDGGVTGISLMINGLSGISLSLF